MNRDEQFRLAKSKFRIWLDYTAPAIVDCGRAIVWRGYAGEKDGYAPWYRVRIDRWTFNEKNEPLNYVIDTESDLPEMTAWMCKHQSYIKGLLIWYCKAVWDLLDNGMLNRKDFDREEDDVDFDENTEDEEEVSVEDWAYGKRYQEYCEQKYGWDCS